MDMREFLVCGSENLPGTFSFGVASNEFAWKMVHRENQIHFTVIGNSMDSHVGEWHIGSVDCEVWNILLPIGQDPHAFHLTSQTAHCTIQWSKHEFKCKEAARKQVAFWWKNCANSDKRCRMFKNWVTTQMHTWELLKARHGPLWCGGNGQVIGPKN